ncbi:MAG: hypothetical protein V4582_20740 [Pseudomonadota bacterium]
MSMSHRMTNLMENVRRLKGPGFVGLGVIVYRRLLGLPVIPLGSQANAHPRLPAQGIDTIADILAEIADRSSPWHDGFHLVDSDTFTLTHVSQFFSPPLPTSGSISGVSEHMGARQMAALLGSRMPNIECIVLLNQDGAVHVFKDGELIANPI